MRAHRGRAARAERSEERPLGRRLRAGPRVVDRGEELEDRARRRHGTGRRARPGPAPGASSRARATPLTSSSSPSRRTPARREHGRVVLALAHLADPRVDVAADRVETRGRGRRPRSCADRRRLLVPTTRPRGARRARGRPGRQGSPGRPRAGRRRRARCPARPPSAGPSANGRRGGSSPVAQRLLELGREEALAADLGKRLAARLRPVSRASPRPAPRRRAPARPRGAARLTSAVCARASGEPRVPTHDRRHRRRAAHRLAARCEPEQLAERQRRRRPPPRRPPARAGGPWARAGAS